MNSNPQNTPSPVTDSIPEPPLENYDNALLDAKNSDCANLAPRKRKSLYSDDSQIGKLHEGPIVGYDKVSPGKVVADPFSVPGSLRNLLTQEFGDDDVSNRHHQLMVIVAHAVMLECGFVAFDKKSNNVVFGFQLPPFDLFYTLPERSSVHGKSIKNVMLEFRSSGEYSVTIRGRLEGITEKLTTHSVRFNESQLVPFTNHVVTDQDIGGKEVFRFWKKIKKNLVLPLLRDLRQVSCSCNRLPLELKLEILKGLSPVDLASSEVLWKMKFVDEFGNVETDTSRSWRKAFTKATRKKRKNNNTKAASTKYIAPMIVPNPPIVRAQYNHQMRNQLGVRRRLI